MKNFSMKKILSLVVATVLLAAMVLGATSCDKTVDEETPATTTAASEAAKPIEIGEGATAFTFEITHMDGSQKIYAVKTDAKTVGEALFDENLIEGDNGAYGLYVKKVNGIIADYDVDKTYWGFYKNGEMMMTGVSAAEFADGESYELVLEG